MKLFGKKRELLRQYRAKRREQLRAYYRHNELRPDLYGWQMKEYQATWATVCKLRDELRQICFALGHTRFNYNLI